MRPHALDEFRQMHSGTIGFQFSGVGGVGATNHLTARWALNAANREINYLLPCVGVSA